MCFVLFPSLCKTLLCLEKCLGVFLHTACLKSTAGTLSPVPTTLTRLYDLLQKPFPSHHPFPFRAERCPVRADAFPCLLWSWSFCRDFCHRLVLGIFAMHNHLVWDHQLVFPAGLQPREAGSGDCCHRGWRPSHPGFTGERLAANCWDQNGTSPAWPCQPACHQRLWPTLLC